MGSPLSKYFKNVGAKRLSAVEVASKKKKSKKTSNQHEFNGSSVFKQFLGLEKRKFNGKFIYLNDDEDSVSESFGSLTWYDSRKNVDHRSAEYRLYYTENDAILSAEGGDLLIIGATTNNELIVIVAQQGSTSEKQLLWLFNIQEIQSKFQLKDLTNEKVTLGFSGKYILASLGIEVEEEAPDYFSELLRLYKGKFPSTKVFSEYARSTVKEVSPVEAPDEALIAWMDREMLLFKTLESVEVKQKLSTGFGADGLDVDNFISYSLSIQNRRKSRAGAAFENHLATIFTLNNIKFSNGKITERNNKPDFVFPNIESYHNEAFNVDLLTMLGLKTTAKDRWRQVLPEADRIAYKHLITLEPSISKNQTDEMVIRKVQLVIPKQILPTYNEEQKKSIIDLSEFIDFVSKKQRYI